MAVLFYKNEKDLTKRRELAKNFHQLLISKVNMIGFYKQATYNTVEKDDVKKGLLHFSCIDDYTTDFWEARWLELLDFCQLPESSIPINHPWLTKVIDDLIKDVIYTDETIYLGLKWTISNELSNQTASTEEDVIKAMNYYLMKAPDGKDFEDVINNLDEQLMVDAIRFVVVDKSISNCGIYKDLNLYIETRLKQGWVANLSKYAKDIKEFE